MHTRGSGKAHEEKRRNKFVGQRLGVTPKSWLTPKRWLLIWSLLFFVGVFDRCACVRWSKYTTTKYHVIIARGS